MAHRVRAARLAFVVASLAWGAASAAPAAAAEPLRVVVASLDTAAGAPVALDGYWFAVDAALAAPAMVLLHGCGGALAEPGGRLSDRMVGYAQWLNALGVHVLVVDSLTPRGERELCTQRIDQRRVTRTQRRRDALGALAWLAARPEVQARRLGLLGWSHGGSAVLAATDRSHPEVAGAPVTPAMAVAFYPGCAAALRQRWQPSAPLLMLVGEDDDWTPPGPCKELAARPATPQPELVSYAGAAHGFDAPSPVRLRLDVPNGVAPGQGVHVGGNPAARAASRAALQAFVRKHLWPD